MTRNQMNVKAVFFDLDDTLSDHQYSRRCGLETLRMKYKTLKEVKIEDLENDHEKILQENYHQTLDGKLSMENAMADRIYRLCSLYHQRISVEEAMAAMIDYRNAYDQNRRSVPGALELLQQLSQRLTVGVVTNGLEDIQNEKISSLGLKPYIYFLLASETIGIRKPNPGIFREAMRLAGTMPENTVFVGDSWTSDILGAHQCGLKTFWLNRYGQESPNSTLAVELNSFKPINSVLDKILAG